MTERRPHVFGRAAVLARTLAATLLAGCTATPDPEPSPPATFIGETLLEARPLLPDGTIAIYDLSTPILDKEATYNDGQPPGAWAIVAQCGTGVGVIPNEDFTGTVKENAERGEYESMLLECGDE